MFPIFPDILQEKEVVIIFLTEIKRKKKTTKAYCCQASYVHIKSRLILRIYFGKMLELHDYIVCSCSHHLV